jgi:hypothetical protein
MSLSQGDIAHFASLTRLHEKHRRIRPLLFVAMFALSFAALTLPAFAHKAPVQLSSAAAAVPDRITQMRPSW